MAGTRRPDNADIRDTAIVFFILGFMVGVIAGACVVAV